MTIHIEKTECIGCGMCEVVCPENAIKVSPGYKAEIDRDACTECLSCINMCPTYSVMEYGQADQKCDVVVIGSGIGGLCAAALLSKLNYRVVLLEKNPLLGGRFTSLWHNDCLFHTGAVIIGHGYDSPVWQILEEVDGKKPEVKEINQFRYRIAGKTYDTYMDQKGALKRLITAVAGEKEEADRFMSAIRKAIAWKKPSDNITLRNWILQYTENEHILRLFQTISSNVCGKYMHELPARAFLKVLGHEASHGGALVPKNGLKDIVDSLAEVITRNGGKVYISADVSKIKVENDRVTGVIAKLGDKTFAVEAGAVVSNAGPIRTIQLTGQKHFDSDYLDEVREKISPSAGMSFHWLSNEPILDFTGIMYVTDTEVINSWIDFNGIWPHWTPEGKYLTGFYPVPSNSPPYNPADIRRIALEDASRLFPDLEDKGAKVVSLHDYRGEWPWLRAPQGIEIGQKTSIQNLYNVGDGVSPGGYSGGDGAAQSAKTVVQSIKDTLKPSKNL